MIQTKDKMLWLLCQRKLCYVVNEGVFEHSSQFNPKGKNISFLSSQNSDSKYFFSNYELVEIQDFSTSLETTDLTAVLNLTQDRYIYDAKFNSSMDLILLVRGQNSNEVWKLNEQFSDPQLLYSSESTKSKLEIDGRFLFLFGEQLDVFEINEQGLLSLPFSVEGSDLNELKALLPFCKAENRILMKDNKNVLFELDLKSMTLRQHLSGLAVSDLWKNEEDDVFILDKQNRIISEQGEVLYSFGDDFYTENEGQIRNTFSKSKGFGIDDNIWLLTNNSLYFLSQDEDNFEYVRVKDDVGKVTSVHEDLESNKTYVLTDNQGLFIYKSSNGELLNQIREDSNEKRIRGFKLRVVSDDIFIYGLNGFYKVLKEENDLEILLSPFFVDGKKFPNRFNYFALDRKLNRAILGSKNNHLFFYDLSTGEQSAHIVEKGSKKRNLVYEIEVFENSDFIILGELAFYLYDHETGEIENAQKKYPNLPDQTNPQISGIRLIGDSLLVISSFGEGLMLYDLKLDSLYRPQGNVFNTAVISDIYSDQQDYIYCSSQIGLLAYHIPTNVLRSIQITSGVREQNIYYRYMHSQSPGAMTIGLINGYTSFYSSDIDVDQSSNVFLSSFDVNGSPVQISGKESLFKFDYTKNNIQLSPISSVSNTLQDQIYQSRLIGLHDDWRTVSLGNKVRYDLLQPGEYTCEIRQLNSTEAPFQLSFEIKLPFFKEPWFIAAILLLVILISSVFYRMRMNFLLKEKQLKVNHELEIAQLEMKSLRSQMNPHFIFNSLNSIKSFIAQNEARVATDYLTKFSHLIRAILNNSRQELVTLNEEREALELYIQMEQVRFENSFEYEFSVQEAVDLDEYLIPPLILQPFVENAIWHGLLHKKTDRKLEIEVKKKTAGVLVKIRDNGIGRAAAVALKSKSATKHKSFGIAITEDRMRMANHDKIGQEIVIRDLKNEKGLAAGTEVEIFISKT